MPTIPFLLADAVKSSLNIQTKPPRQNCWYSRAFSIFQTRLCRTGSQDLPIISVSVCWLTFKEESMSTSSHLWLSTIFKRKHVVNRFWFRIASSLTHRRKKATRVNLHVWGMCLRARLAVKSLHINGRWLLVPLGKQTGLISTSPGDI